MIIIRRGDDVKVQNTKGRRCEKWERDCNCKNLDAMPSFLYVLYLYPSPQPFLISLFSRSPTSVSSRLSFSAPGFGYIASSPRGADYLISQAD